MSKLNRRLQLLLDEGRFHRLEREAERRGAPVASVLLEGVDRLRADETDRRAAGDCLLAAPPMAIDDWPEMKEPLEAVERR